MKVSTPLLQRWFIVGKFKQLQAPASLSNCRIHGIVKGHQAIEDGMAATTSPVVSQVSGKIVTASGSTYTLGDVHPEYDKLYPDAKESLLKALADTFPKP